ncbi:hypothetical protein M427DRAFT_59245 [Gonapodya prolifera JEL478]|uniref:Uncharacterized protein n=1 Tax=Gonapodya prolifera (strain JEL478) TaxID=1344416 RepID=A0A139A7D8_GONPJ|nr:hypothetical protein M427DRAFT_59245 [Gonapodya prolifera JEL478]|eukprot:KXS12721.1 hypothetical protein M427DRAFT_59245 [Gonapodya prolifera JEL478]
MGGIVEIMFDGSRVSNFTALAVMQLPCIERLSFRDCENVDLFDLNNLIGKCMLAPGFATLRNSETPQQLIDLTNCGKWTKRDDEGVGSKVLMLLYGLGLLFPNIDTKPALCTNCPWDPSGVTFAAADCPEELASFDLTHPSAVELSKSLCWKDLRRATCDFCCANLELSEGVDEMECQDDTCIMWNSVKVCVSRDCTKPMRRSCRVEGCKAIICWTCADFCDPQCCWTVCGTRNTRRLRRGTLYAVWYFTLYA